MRVPRPEAQAQPAPPLRALACGEARHLQHGGVGRAVVHHAVVPGVVMARVQDERTIRVRPIDLGLQYRRLPPAGIDLGMQRHLRLLAARQTLAQGAAIGVRHRAHHGRRQVGLRLARRAAPYRRYAHLVQMLVRADLHLTHGTGVRGVRRLARTGDALHQHDRAAQVAPGEIGCVAIADIDQPSRHAIGRRATREGMRDAGQRMVVHIDTRLARQADIGVVHDQPGPVAVLVQLGLKIAEALQLIRCAGQLHPACKFPHVPHEDRAVDGLAQRMTH